MLYGLSLQSIFSILKQHPKNNELVNLTASLLLDMRTYYNWKLLHDLASCRLGMPVNTWHVCLLEC